MAHDIIGAWQTMRAELAAMERAEHPDIIDRHGRAWQWKARDLYTHDETLAFPLDMLASLGLPARGLAEHNPNYARLCAVCRHEAVPESDPDDCDECSHGRISHGARGCVECACIGYDAGADADY